MSEKWAVPANAFIDTSALLHGLGVGKNHPESELCRQFLDEMESSGSRIFVSALSIAEMRRKRSRPEFEALPRVRSIIPVPLNAEVGHVCGDLFPWPQSAPDDDKTRLKFDIAIVASAVWLQRLGTDIVFVTIDADQRKRAEEKQVPTSTPSDFQPRQLRLVPVSPSKK
jgi:predicted nucleic acid-binding protein